MTSRHTLAGFTQEYLVGIEELDEQHKTFFTLLDAIGKAVPDLYRPLCEAEADAVIDVLGELRDSALLHFRTEEGYMQEIEYPGLARQKREHNRFITDVIRMEGELMNGTIMPAITIRNFMHDWYCDHILTLDKPFGQTYKKIKE
ncbi:MAG: hemerythrin family protein [Pseudomonadota bacterium]